MKKSRDGESVIAFSLDVDWADDEMLAYALQLFRDKKIPLTVFATHKTKILYDPPDGIDIGIHPNFFYTKRHRNVVADLLRLYPNARGVRSHGLFEYSNLMDTYNDLGLAWDSSQLLYLCSHIKPYRHPSGIVRLPIFWEDDDYLRLQPDWAVEKLNLREPGVKCLDFHPAHLRINSFSPDQYCHVKKHKFSKAAVAEAEYKGRGKGIRNFFNDVVRFIAQNKLAISTCKEVALWA